jgi:hypothetical protein
MNLQHASVHVSIRQHTSAGGAVEEAEERVLTYEPAAYVSVRQHTSAYVSIRQHTSAYVAHEPEHRALPHHFAAHQQPLAVRARLLRWAEQHP